MGVLPGSASLAGSTRGIQVDKGWWQHVKVKENQEGSGAAAACDVLSGCSPF